MFITKSLYKEFCQFPKLARWHVNDKKVYTAINEAEYGTMDGAEIGQDVEDVVKKLWDSKQIFEVKIEDHKDFHQNYALTTSKALAQNPAVLYQSGFLVDDLFVKVDFLVKNEQGTYDIVEVKSSNTPLTTTKIPTLKADLCDDMSFQRYVLKKALPDLFSGKVYLYHLNKDYVKHGPIVPKEIIKILDVGEYLDGEENVEHTIQAMRNNLPVSESSFATLYPFEGGDYFLYHGKDPEKGTIFCIPRITQSKKRLQMLLDRGKLYIKDLDQQDINDLGNGDETSSLQTFVNNWLQGEVIDKEAIKEEFAKLRFPLYFYDYETVSGPIPIFEGTSPWQQVVVQYSLHKMEADGSTSHHASIIDFDVSDNRNVVDAFMKDMDDANGTCIVWNKGFECGKNKEMADQYPTYRAVFETINANTFDLMEIFKKQYYFHKNFNGSASIKKVLPVLTDISYDDLEVGNGGIATELLKNIVLGKMTPEDYATNRKNLLTYCEQDTWAMVEIYRKVLAKIC